MQSSADRAARRPDPDGAEREGAAAARGTVLRELKSRVVQAYYTSEIGIKQEMEYKGNSYLAEFSGVDVS